ncbi:hypothetical protein ACYTX7_09640, partial [Streptococcus pyogenes]
IFLSSLTNITHSLYLPIRTDDKDQPHGNAHSLKIFQTTFITEDRVIGPGPKTISGITLSV